MTDDTETSLREAKPPLAFPVIEELLLETALYQEIDLGGSHQYVYHLEFRGGHQFDAHCVECGRESLFKINKEAALQPKSLQQVSSPITTLLSDHAFSLTFACQRNFSHKYHFMFVVNSGRLSKIGQYPSAASISYASVNRFTGVLGKSYLSDFKRALGLYAHGIGAGSFVYLRRIFEHLLNEAADVARVLEGLPENFDSFHMDQKIKVLGRNLPKEVAEAADVYSVLSAGIHALTEEKCRALFPVMRSSIEYILDGMLAERARLQHAANVRSALGRAKNETTAIIKGAAK